MFRIIAVVIVTLASSVETTFAACYAGGHRR